MQKVETCDPASIVVELEWPTYSLMQALKYAPTDVKKKNHARKAQYFVNLHARVSQTVEHNLNHIKD